SGDPIALLDFGNPAQVTDLTLCVFDQNGLALSATAPAGGSCGTRPCWSTAPTSIRYGDRDGTPDGLTSLVLKAGDVGRAAVTGKGTGAARGLPPRGLATPVTVRLKRSGGPACWEARYPTARRNDPTQFRAKTP